MSTREHAALGRAFVDLANQRVEMSAANFAGLPPIYKRYPRTGRVPLPAEPGGDVLRSPRELGRLLRDVNGLSAMLWGRGLLDLGGRSEDRRPPDPTLVRHVPAGGARYPVELYAAVGPLGSLPAGLYHYDPRHHALDRLRSGDPRAAVVDSLGSPPDPFPDLVLLFSVVLWRGAAKYGEFAYRLQSLDLGVVVGQALAAAGALGLDGAVHLLFADPALDGLLGLSAPAESVLAVVTLSGAGGTAPGGLVSPEPPPAAESPGHEITGLPRTLALQAASRSARPPALRATTRRVRDAAPRHRDIIRLPGGDALDLAAGIPRRRSTFTGYERTTLPLDALARLLTAVTRPYASDTGESTLLCCAVDRVAGIEPGAYYYEPRSRSLALIEAGDAVGRFSSASALTPRFRRECLTANLVLVPVADYESGFAGFGDRWYRMQNIEAGVLIERICLAAAALGLESHPRCDFDVAAANEVFGLSDGPLQSLAVVTVGPPRPNRRFPEHRIWTAPERGDRRG